MMDETTVVLTMAQAMVADAELVWTELPEVERLEWARRARVALGALRGLGKMWDESRVAELARIMRVFPDPVEATEHPEGPAAWWVARAERALWALGEVK